MAISSIISFLGSLNFDVMLYCKTEGRIQYKKILIPFNFSKCFRTVSFHFHFFFTKFRTYINSLPVWNVEIKYPSRLYVIPNYFINRVAIPQYLSLVELIRYLYMIMRFFFSLYEGQESSDRQNFRGILSSYKATVYLFCLYNYRSPW